MWKDQRKKLEELKAVDSQHAAFGARIHRYALRPALTEDEVRALETNLRIQFPGSIRSFYREMGDGVAGPAYGVIKAADLKGYRPDEEYPGIAALRTIAELDGSGTNADGYFEAPREALAGLLPIVQQGCGHQLCAITRGDGVGQIVDVSADGFLMEMNRDFEACYSEWLDRELQCFDAVHCLMLTGVSLDDLLKQMRERFGDHAADRIASIANVPKPEKLFGTANNIYHWAAQRPWFEQVLDEWRQANAL